MSDMLSVFGPVPTETNCIVDFQIDGNQWTVFGYVDPEQAAIEDRVNVLILLPNMPPLARYAVREIMGKPVEYVYYSQSPDSIWTAERFEESPLYDECLDVMRDLANLRHEPDPIRILMSMSPPAWYPIGPADPNDSRRFLIKHVSGFEAYIRYEDLNSQSGGNQKSID